MPDSGESDFAVAASSASAVSSNSTTPPSEAKQRPDNRQQCLLALSAVVSLVVVLRTSGKTHIGGDSTSYYWREDAISAGNWSFYGLEDPAHFPPLYPAILALFRRAFPGDPALTINILSVVSVVWGISHLVSLVYPDRTRQSGILRVCLPIVSVVNVWVISGHALVAMPEMLFFASVIWSLVFASRFLAHGRTLDLLLATALIGLATGVRFAGAFVALGLFAGMAVNLLRRGKAYWLAIVPLLAVVPTLVWRRWVAAQSGPMSAVGRVDSHYIFGHATVIDSGVSSLAAFGAAMVGLPHDRVFETSRQASVGGYSVQVTFPYASNGTAVVLILCMGVLGLLAFGILGLGSTRLLSKEEDGRSQAVGLISIACLIYSLIFVFIRAHDHMFVLGRYWLFVPVICLLVLCHLVSSEMKVSTSYLSSESIVRVLVGALVAWQALVVIVTEVPASLPAS